MAITPDEKNLVIYKGADRRWEFRLTTADGEPLLMGGWQVKAQIREKWGLDAPLVAAFNVDDASLSVDGSFVLTLDRAVTREMTARKGVYDIFLIGPDNRAYPYIRGEVEIFDSATDVGSV